MTYPWPGGARAAVCFTFDFDGEAPYLWRTRNGHGPAVGELEQRRYGPRRGVANLLAMLAGLDLRATAFVPGWIAAEYPGRVAEIHAGGHELALHGWCHEPPSDLTAGDLGATLERSARTLEGITGERPTGYRSPSWDMTPDVFPVLRELGIGYDSSLMGDDVPYEVDGVIEIPVDWTTDDAPYYRYVGGDPRPPATTRPIRDAWAAEIAAAKEHGTLCMITVHPWLSGRPARVAVLEELLGAVVADPELCTPAVGELAGHHRAQGGGRTVSLGELGGPGHE